MEAVKEIIDQLQIEYPDDWNTYATVVLENAGIDIDDYDVWVGNQ